MKKWTKARRAMASKKAKELWSKRRAAKLVPTAPEWEGGSGGSANASSIEPKKSGPDLRGAVFLLWDNDAISSSDALNLLREIE